MLWGRRKEEIEKWEVLDYLYNRKSSIVLLEVERAKVRDSPAQLISLPDFQFGVLFFDKDQKTQQLTIFRGFCHCFIVFQNPAWIALRDSIRQYASRDSAASQSESRFPYFAFFLLSLADFRFS